jgi:outer membrane biosynthesis protein TonB
MAVLRQLDEALGPGALDKPIFAANEQKLQEIEQSSSNLPILVSLKNGEYDGYFTSDKKLSQLYQESLSPSSLPSVELISSDFETSGNRVLPIYPPIAKAAHVEGIVETTFDVSPSGNTSNAQRVSGPELLEKATTDTILQWTFPPSSEIRHEHAKIAFRLTCKNPTS